MERIAQLSRRRMGKSYRKRLGMFNYKVKTYGIRKIKKPDQVPLEEKVKLLKVSNSLMNKIQPEIRGEAFCVGSALFSSENYLEKEDFFVLNKSDFPLFLIIF